MKQYRITLGDRTFEVKVLSDPLQEQVQVEVDGESLTVLVKAVSSAAEVSAADAVTSATPVPPSALAPPPDPAAVPSTRTVTAPLPGVIKSIRVRPGQQVSVDDEIVVIEAMKMDNVIRAQRTGTIGTVHVTEGRQVAHGDPLLDYAD